VFDACAKANVRPVLLPCAHRYHHMPLLMLFGDMAGAGVKVVLPFPRTHTLSHHDAHTWAVLAPSWPRAPGLPTQAHSESAMEGAAARARQVIPLCVVGSMMDMGATQVGQLSKPVLMVHPSALLHIHSVTRANT
jgi:hypothetical protein